MDSKNTPEENSLSAEELIWQGKNQPAKNGAPPRRSKKKHRWGFLEIIISFALLLGVQVAYSLIVMTAILQDRLASGATLDDVDVVTTEILTEITTNPTHLTFFMVSMYIIWVGTMFYATWFRGLKSFAKDFWLRFNWKRDIPIGIGIAIGLRALEIAILSAVLALGVDLTGSGNTESIIGQEGIWYFIIAILFASFIGPLCEELFFRGFLLQAFLRNFRRGNISGPRGNFGNVVKQTSPGLFKVYVSFRNFLFRHKYTFAIVLSGLLFGLMHWQGTNDIAGWLAVIETSIVGMLLGYIVIKTKRLGLAIVIHCMFNLSGVILASMGV